MIRENTEETRERASQSRASQSNDSQPSILRRQQATEQRQHGGRNGRRAEDQRSDGRRASRSVRADEKADGTNIRIGSPDSQYEREAEKVARRVTAETYGGGDAAGRTVSKSATVSDAPTGVQRSPAETEQEATDTGGQTVPESVRDVVSTPGQKMDPEVVRRVESQTGEEFGDVSVHTGPKAAKSARDVGARAYTVGSDIVFDSGEYAPGTPSGDSVIAHELTHVAQQSRGVSRLQRLGKSKSARQGPTPLSESQLDERLEAAVGEYVRYFLENDYRTAVRRQARKELDVSDSADGAFEHGQRKPRRSEMRKRIEAAVSHQAKTDVTKKINERVKDKSDENYTRDAKTDYERERAKHRAEEQASQSVDAELARYADEVTEQIVAGERDVQARSQLGVAALFGADTDSAVSRFVEEFKRGISRRRNRGKAASVLKSSHRGQTGMDLSTAELNEAYTKTLRNISLDRLARRQVKRVTGNAESAITERAKKRAREEDDVAEKAVQVQANSASSGFEKLGKRLEQLVPRGDTVIVTASITIKSPDKEVPISGTISTKLLVENDAESGGYTVMGNVMLGIGADIEAVSAGLHFGKKFSVTGSGAENAMLMLSYMLYRQSLSFGTERIADHAWGSGQDKRASARRRAQRWAAATEQRLLEDPNAAGETGVVLGGDFSVGGDTGAASGSFSATVNVSTAEYYDPVAIRYALDQRKQTIAGIPDFAGIKNKLKRADDKLAEKGLKNPRTPEEAATAMAGARVTDSKERRRREKQSGGRKNQLEAKVSLSGSVGVGPAKLSCSLFGKGTADDIDGLKLYVLATVPAAGSFVNALGDVADLVFTGANELANKSNDYKEVGLEKSDVNDNMDEIKGRMKESAKKALLSGDEIGVVLKLEYHKDRGDEGWNKKQRLAYRLALVKKQGYGAKPGVPGIVDLSFNYTRQTEIIAYDKQAGVDAAGGKLFIND